jgi:hypothetical protein
LLGGDIAGNGLSKLFLTIAAAFAEAERNRIRERIGQVKADQKARGRYLGGKVPFRFRRGGAFARLWAGRETVGEFPTVFRAAPGMALCRRAAKFPIGKPLTRPGDRDPDVMPSLTYAELAEALKITPASANKLARRRRWPRLRATTARPGSRCRRMRLSARTSPRRARGTAPRTTGSRADREAGGRTRRRARGADRGEGEGSGG